MNKHEFCPDENNLCVHGEDYSCPAFSAAKGGDSYRPNDRIATSTRADMNAAAPQTSEDKPERVSQAETPSASRPAPAAVPTPRMTRAVREARGIEEGCKLEQELAHAREQLETALAAVDQFANSAEAHADGTDFNPACGGCRSLLKKHASIIALAAQGEREKP